ncbi:Imm1 family immunity protein [Streptomyces sp. NPDC047315]|uniref:Imm1 family immunity protein n=1 Tax=Streptomyces sp. NPDC047315 TaxID=3155142 RepID=UPI0033F72E1A
MARAEARYRLEHGEEPLLLGADDDVDALISALLMGPAHENLAQVHSLDRQLMPSGFPDHELLVGVDGALSLGLLAYLDAEGNVVTLGPPESRTDPVYCIQGNRTEFPAHSEVSVDLVREALKEFLSSGGMRPTCVQWQAADNL